MWHKQDPVTQEDRTIRVLVKAAPREEFKGYGSNIGRYFLSHEETELLVSKRELEVLKGESFLTVVVLDKRAESKAEAPTEEAESTQPEGKALERQGKRK